jgi:hypothetical protein
MYLSGKQNNAHAKFYNPSELVAVDEVIVFFKKSMSFIAIIPTKHPTFGTKIHRLCNKTTYPYNKSI